MLILVILFSLLKLYGPVITLSEKGNQKLWKLLNKGFKRSIYWNGYKTVSKNKNVRNEYRKFSQIKFCWSQ